MVTRKGCRRSGMVAVRCVGLMDWWGRRCDTREVGEVVKDRVVRPREWMLDEGEVGNGARRAGRRSIVAAVQTRRDCARFDKQAPTYVLGKGRASRYGWREYKLEKYLSIST